MITFAQTQFYSDLLSHHVMITFAQTQFYSDLLSHHVISSDLRRGLANTDVDRDNNVSIGQMTSLIYVIIYSKRQQVRTKLRLLFICFAVFSPFNLLIMHDKYKKQVSAFQCHARPETHRTGSASLAIPSFIAVSSLA